MSDKTFPITASEGGDNMHVVPCDVYQGRRHYAVCLRILNRKNSGDALLWEADCNAAIACGNCPAAGLREQELQAGHALFYEPRDLDRFQKVGPEEIFTQSYQSGWGKPQKGVQARLKANKEKARQQATPAPRKSKPKKSAGSAHADLVNKLIEEEKDAKQRDGSE